MNVASSRAEPIRSPRRSGAPGDPDRAGVEPDDARRELDVAAHLLEPVDELSDAATDVSPLQASQRVLERVAVDDVALAAGQTPAVLDEELRVRRR